MIAATFRVCCDTDGCDAIGPGAPSCVAAFRAARARGWTRRIETAQHRCPVCTGTDEALAAAERATVAEMLAEGHADPVTVYPPGVYGQTRADRRGQR